MVKEVSSFPKRFCLGQASIPGPVHYDLWGQLQEQAMQVLLSGSNAGNNEAHCKSSRRLSRSYVKALLMKSSYC